jgi:spore maturation protein CgeB
MNILFIGNGSANSSSSHRAKALERIGCSVFLIDPYLECKVNFSNKWKNKLHYITGYKLLQKKIEKWVLTSLKTIANQVFELVWVDSGELLGVDIIKQLNKMKCPVLLYNLDDPTGNRDGNKFSSLLKSLPFYDYCVVVRNINIEEYKKLGAKNIIFVSRSYDEVIHQPFNKKEDIPEKFISDICFVGTWMPKENRDVLFVKLIEEGLNVSIWGTSWNRSLYYNILRPYIKGDSIYTRDYVAAIQGAKICIGLLSKGNRDLVTQRTFEIPFIGGLFCAERTEEHLSLYRDFEEAVFWDDPDECTIICKKLLNDSVLREQIRAAGMKKVRAMQLGNEDICLKILKSIKLLY